MKVAINRIHGGFRFSEAGHLWLHNERGWAITEYVDNGYGDAEAKIVRNDWEYGPKYDFVGDLTQQRELRTDPDIIAAVETLGHAVNSPLSSILIVEVPDDVSWHIHEDRGFEHIAEDHRTWEPEVEEV